MLHEDKVSSLNKFEGVSAPSHSFMKAMDNLSPLRVNCGNGELCTATHGHPGP